MSLNALKYDDCSYTHQLRESISPGDYMIGTPRPCDPCFVVSPGVTVDRFGASLCDKNLVDVNSELLNITRKASDCPSKKYVPSADPYCQVTHFKECTSLVPEETLISNPKCTGKEATINRWEWLCRNPQDKALMPFDWFIPNRLVAKDSHRPCLQKPLDQHLALPPAQAPKCKNYMDEQFQEGDWKNMVPRQPQQPYHSQVVLATCQKIPKL
jgi:hypothetical protein